MSNIVRLSISSARSISLDLLGAFGAPPSHAAVVTDHLVDTELCGIRSHGLIRLPEYVQSMIDGEVDPTAIPTARRVSETIVAIDGGRGFGQLAVGLAVEQVQVVASEHGMGLATVRNSGHAGRLGAYAEQLGRNGYLAVVACSSSISAHMVAPYRGREGRLATNPIAFAIPRHGEPIVGDFSTASLPEGRIRNLRDRGLSLPEETLLDSDGRPTTDPHALYATPRGVIMPFGGSAQGHRGFALACYWQRH